MKAMRSFETSEINEPDIQRNSAEEQNNIVCSVALKYELFSLLIVHMLLWSCAL